MIAVVVVDDDNLVLFIQMKGTVIAVIIIINAMIDKSKMIMYFNLQNKINLFNKNLIKIANKPSFLH